MKYLICILLLLPMKGLTQDREFPLVRKIQGEFALFSVDNLGNLYLLNKENQLKKLNPEGDSLGVFNNVRRYGKLYSIHTVNPLKTLLYYRDFRTIIVLDRLLSQVNTIDLRMQNILQVKAISPSYDNNIWIFDEQESKLKKIGEDGKVLSETADLRLVLGDATMPAQIFDQNGFVYLYDPAGGMFVFDYYGALKTKIAILQWTDVQVLGNTILGRLNGKLMSYTTGTLQTKEIQLPATLGAAQNVRIMPQGIYLLDADGISLYSLSRQ